MTEKEKIQIAVLGQDIKDFRKSFEDYKTTQCKEMETIKSQTDRQGEELNKIRGIGIAITVFVSIIEAIAMWLGIHKGG